MERFMSYDFDITNIVFAGYIAGKKGSEPHINRPSHGVAFHLSGEKEYVFKNGYTTIVRANDIIYLPKYSDYTVSTIVVGDCYAVNFDIAENISFSPFTIHPDNHSYYIKYFRNVMTALSQKKQGYMMRCKGELYNILYAMQQEHPGIYMPKSKKDLILPALDYIHNNYTTELLNIEKLAAMCNITSAYFRKIFSGVYGISPLIYIKDLKISRAKELIASGMYSITESAFQSGYTDMSHFSREFKKATGYSPSEYKKKCNMITL